MTANRDIWTPGAIDCYLKLCNCSRCNIPEMMETHCMMKYTVARLVLNIGEPTEDDCRKAGIPYETFKKAREQIQIIDE